MVLLNSDICIAPWNMLRIENSGNCYICTSNFHKISLGNIFEKSFDEIWNGNEIRKIRKNILSKNDYSYCKTELCLKFGVNAIESYGFKVPEELEEYTKDYPKLIYFAFDCSCNQKCVFCRDEVSMMSKEEVEKWTNVFEEKILPIIKYVRIVELNHAGEFLDGKFSRNMISKMLEINENLEFNLITNGVSFNEKNIKSLGIENKINTIHVSLHSATRETYKKIFRRDNFNKVIENLEYIKRLKKDNKIKNFEIMFVICSLNYKDILLFINLTKRFFARPSFSLINYNSGAEYASEKIEYEIFSPFHRHYNNFVKILKNDLLKEYMNSLPPHLLTLDYIGKKQVISNYINYFKRRKDK